MEIKIVKTGYLEENCYVLIKDKQALLIDPGDDSQKIKEVLKDNELVGILITHDHFDHVGALSYFVLDNIPIIKRENVEERNYTIKNFNFDVIYTFGHTDDSITFYFEDYGVMFTGDFLFKEDIGRCDLPTGSEEEMDKSLEKIIKYSKDIVIYPGHGESSTIGYEINNNEYIKGEQL